MQLQFFHFAGEVARFVLGHIEEIIGRLGLQAADVELHVGIRLVGVAVALFNGADSRLNLGFGHQVRESRRRRFAGHDIGEIRLVLINRPIEGSRLVQREGDFR